VGNTGVTGSETRVSDLLPAISRARVLQTSRGLPSHMTATQYRVRPGGQAWEKLLDCGADNARTRIRGLRDRIIAE